MLGLFLICFLNMQGAVGIAQERVEDTLKPSFWNRWSVGVGYNGGISWTGEDLAHPYGWSPIGGIFWLIEDYLPATEVSEIQETKEAPLWVYGGEFLGGEIGEAMAIGVTGIWILLRWEGKEWSGFPSTGEVVIVYTLTSTLLSGCCTWGVGKLLKQDNSIRNTLIGAFLGSTLGSFGVIASYGTTSRIVDIIGIGIAVISPSIGAVIGYNWK